MCSSVCSYMRPCVLICTARSTPRQPRGDKQSHHQPHSQSHHQRHSHDKQSHHHSNLKPPHLDPHHQHSHTTTEDDRHTDTQIHRQKDRKTYTQTHRHTDRQTDRARVAAKPVSRPTNTNVTELPAAISPAAHAQPPLQPRTVAHLFMPPPPPPLPECPDAALVSGIA